MNTPCTSRRVGYARIAGFPAEEEPTSARFEQICPASWNKKVGVKGTVIMEGLPQTQQRSAVIWRNITGYACVVPVVGVSRTPLTKCGCANDY